MLEVRQHGAESHDEVGCNRPHSEDCRRWPCGSKVLRDWVPDFDATAVVRLRKAGAVIIGKTNLHEFAYGVTNDNPHFGPTRNQHWTARNPPPLTHFFNSIMCFDTAAIQWPEMSFRFLVLKSATRRIAVRKRIINGQCRETPRGLQCEEPDNFTPEKPVHCIGVLLPQVPKRPRAQNDCTNSK